VDFALYRRARVLYRVKLSDFLDEKIIRLVEEEFLEEFSTATRAKKLDQLKAEIDAQLERERQERERQSVTAWMSPGSWVRQ
jgi:FKBP-type peptidyl-prolyl cis-trans isomerase (trigger factor)